MRLPAVTDRNPSAIRSHVLPLWCAVFLEADERPGTPIGIDSGRRDFRSKPQPLQGDGSPLESCLLSYTCLLVAIAPPIATRNQPIQNAQVAVEALGKTRSPNGDKKSSPISPAAPAYRMSRHPLFVSTNAMRKPTTAISPE